MTGQWILSLCSLLPPLGVCALDSNFTHSIPQQGFGESEGHHDSLEIQQHFLIPSMRGGPDTLGQPEEGLLRRAGHPLVPPPTAVGALAGSLRPPAAQALFLRFQEPFS